MRGRAALVNTPGGPVLPWCSRSMNVKRTVITVLIALVVAAAVTSGCTLLGAEPEDPVRRQEFLEPVRDAQEAGVDVYWMGASFLGGSGEFEISGKTWPVESGGQIVGVQFEYSSRGGLFVLRALSKGGGSVEAFQEAARREGARSATAGVGSWSGELYYLPGGVREVNQLWLFVDLGETVVFAVAPSGDTGVPGTDSNPLLEDDLLIQTVASYLRPYPE